MTDKNTNQLTFDFSARAKNLLRTNPKLANRSKSAFEFREEASSIMNDRFIIKWSYLGRSYLVQWTYRIGETRSFWNREEITREVASVRYDRIDHYINGGYIRAYLQGRDEAKIKKEIETILSNPAYNQNLATVHDQDDIFA